MEGFRAKRQAIFIISLVLRILNVCCMSEPETTSPMEISERDALYSVIQGFVGKWWNGSKLYPDLWGWTLIQHGHVGFMLSCYDAELSYDRHTDTFHARYPPHGRRTIVIEEGIELDRLRAAPVDTPPHNIHIFDCLNDLQPGDHIEIQWRRNKEFPYGWWYGVVGHLESCDRNEIYCRCHTSVFSIGRI